MNLWFYEIQTDFKVKMLSLILNTYSKFTHVKISVMSTKCPGVYNG